MATKKMAGVLKIDQRNETLRAALLVAKAHLEEYASTIPAWRKNELVVQKRRGVEACIRLVDAEIAKVEG